jgi:hypothetical protein
MRSAFNARHVGEIFDTPGRYRHRNALRLILPTNLVVARTKDYSLNLVLAQFELTPTLAASKMGVFGEFSMYIYLVPMILVRKETIAIYLDLSRHTST